MDFSLIILSAITAVVIMYIALVKSSSKQIFEDIQNYLEFIDKDELVASAVHMNHRCKFYDQDDFLDYHIRTMCTIIEVRMQNENYNVTYTDVRKVINILVLQEDSKYEYIRGKFIGYYLNNPYSEEYEPEIDEEDIEDDIEVEEESSDTMVSLLDAINDANL